MSDDEQPKRRAFSNADQAWIDAMRVTMHQTIGTDLELKGGIWITNPETGERCEISKSEGGYVFGAVVKE